MIERLSLAHQTPYIFAFDLEDLSDLVYLLGYLKTMQEAGDVYLDNQIHTLQKIKDLALDKAEKG